MTIDGVRLFLINICCYCSGSRRKKVIDKNEILYSYYADLKSMGYSNLKIYDVMFCR